MPRFALFALLPFALAACASQVDTSTGTSTTPAAGGTETSDPGVPTPTTPACPTEAPGDGVSCTGDLSCPYPSSCGSTVTAVCQSGAWEVPALATCGPYPYGTGCDPVAIWSVHLAWAPDAFYAPFGENDFDLPIQADAQGALVVLGPGSAKIQGCTLTAHWTLSESTSEYGSESVYQELVLTFFEDSATGTASRTCVGECGGLDEATVSATRLP